MVQHLNDPKPCKTCQGAGSTDPSVREQTLFKVSQLSDSRVKSQYGFVNLDPDKPQLYDDETDLTHARTLLAMLSGTCEACVKAQIIKFINDRYINEGVMYSPGRWMKSVLREVDFDYTGGYAKRTTLV